MVDDLFNMENRFESFHFSCIGAGHIRQGSPCQDASDSVKEKCYSMAVVCDGHGGADYFRSDRGSRMAAEAFRGCVADKNFVRQLDMAESAQQVEELARQLVKSVILRWNNAVEEDMAQDPFTEEEMQGISDRARSRYAAGQKLPAIYGTTLLGFICGRLWCFGVQIGDGRCVLANSWGQLYQPIPADERCFLNVTTSLSDENAFEEFRFWAVKSLDKDFPIAVFLGSDGIEDSFAGDEKLLDFYRLVLKNIADSRSTAPIDELFAYLPTLSSRGSGDDMSVGILITPNSVYWDPERWSGTGRQIYIDNFGDMDADSYERSYCHKSLIPAQVGSYQVPIGRYGQRIIEVTAVEQDRVRLRYDGQEYTLTAREQLVFRNEDYQASYDGPWHNASDTTWVTLL